MIKKARWRNCPDFVLFDMLVKRLQSAVTHEACQEWNNAASNYGDCQMISFELISRRGSRESDQLRKACRTLYWVTMWNAREYHKATDQLFCDPLEWEVECGTH